MKYIKMFEYFENNFYKEVPDPFHTPTIENMEKFHSSLEEFNSEEVSKIKSYLPTMRVELEKSSEGLIYWGDVPRIVVYYHDYVGMEIFKMIDEWYMVRIPTSQKDTNFGEFDNIMICKTFKCDQLEAVRYILDEKNF
jgi:hypothetical protein